MLWNFDIKIICVQLYSKPIDVFPQYFLLFLPFWMILTNFEKLG